MTKDNKGTQEWKQHTAIGPVAGIPDYPDDMPLAKEETLENFFDNQCKWFDEISRWIGQKCYLGKIVFTTHGDIGTRAIIIQDFKLSEVLQDRLFEKVTVQVQDEDQNGVSIDELFPGENGSKLRPEERTKKDPLGFYRPNEKRIVLFQRKIVKCGNKLDQAIKDNPDFDKTPCAMTLFYNVLLHELGHAIHHTMSGFCRNWGTDKEQEALAQHFAMTCISKYGNERSRSVFEELEKRQHPIYGAWRELGPCNWDNCKNNYEKQPEVISYKECLDMVKNEDKPELGDLLDI